MADDEVVLLTGSSGFLGQHIVRLLQETDDRCNSIRLLDVKPYRNSLGHRTDKPMQELTGSVTNFDDVMEACKGVTAVIHSAADVGVDISTDLQQQKRVNVQGTENVIEACLQQGVCTLVYTSTVDVNTGNEDVIDGDEDHLPALPSGCLFWNYAETKYEAETKVLEADGKTTKKGNMLRSLVLRPTVMYGEQDRFLVYSLLKSGKNRGGDRINRIGDGNAIIQMTYVGNVAWAHIVAKNELLDRPSEVAGQVYFVTDDTKVDNVFEVIGPFAEAVDLKISDRKIPYWLVYGLVYLAEVATAAINKIHKVSSSIPPASGGIAYICTSFTFSKTKATSKLRYKPIYERQQAIERSSKFYETCPYR